MTKVYLVRHAEIDFIPDDYSRPLSQKGKEDVKKVTEFFKNKNITRVLSSPYIRALHTVEGIAKDKGLDIEVVDDFRERKVANSYIEDFETFSELQWKDFDYFLEGGESLNQVQKRGIKALFDVVDKYKGENIVIGTHGTILGVILNYFDKKYDFNFWKTIKMPDIFLLEFEDRKLKHIKNIAIEK